MLPDKMVYPGDNNYIGYKNGDQFSACTGKMAASNPKKKQVVLGVRLVINICQDTDLYMSVIIT